MARASALVSRRACYTARVVWEGGLAPVHRRPGPGMAAGARRPPWSSPARSPPGPRRARGSRGILPHRDAAVHGGWEIRRDRAPVRVPRTRAPGGRAGSGRRGTGNNPPEPAGTVRPPHRSFLSGRRRTASARPPPTHCRPAPSVGPPPHPRCGRAGPGTARAAARRPRPLALCLPAARIPSTPHPQDSLVLWITSPNLWITP